MNLGEIKAMVKKESGRYDLTDSELTEFINKAQRWLDRNVDHFKAVAREIVTIDEGDFYVKFTDCRTVQKVFVAGDDIFSELTYNKGLLEEFKTFYKEMYSTMKKGRPLMYAPAHFRYHHIEDGIIGYMDVMADWPSYNGIILLPPADKTYHVEIWGKFFMKPLVNDSDESFWTIEEPLILVKAVMREIEAFHRNTQGVRDWTAELAQDLYQLECDFIEDDITTIDQMEG